MALEGLMGLIETLRARISQHGTVLRQNEMATRYILIDPLLRELGWDTENPEQVIPEFRSGSGPADYVLLKDGKPIVVVEAKRLGTSIGDGLIQAINYCVAAGILYFAVTDGRSWELYETHNPVPIAEKRIVGFDLVAEASATVALKALTLWRPAVELGRIKLPEEPLVGQMVEVPTTSPPPQITPSEAGPEPAHSNSDSTWNALSKFQPIKHDTPPKMLRVPDGSERTLGRWNSLPLEVVKWLMSSGILTAENCPIRSAGRYLVNVAPEHPGGKPFTAGKQVGQLYIESNYSGPDQHRNTITIIKHLGRNPDEFAVRF